MRKQGKVAAKTCRSRNVAVTRPVESRRKLDLQEVDDLLGELQKEQATAPLPKVKWKKRDSDGNVIRVPHSRRSQSNHASCSQKTNPPVDVPDTSSEVVFAPEAIAMGEMRLEVIVDGGMQRRGVAVPRQASISDGGRHSVDGVGRAVVSLQARLNGDWLLFRLCPHCPSGRISGLRGAWVAGAFVDS
ncbi:unnamed protein product [Boreogadus saida]